MTSKDLQWVFCLCLPSKGGPGGIYQSLRYGYFQFMFRFTSHCISSRCSYPVITHGQKLVESFHNSILFSMRLIGLYHLEVHYLLRKASPALFDPLDFPELCRASLVYWCLSNFIKVFDGINQSIIEWIFIQISYFNWISFLCAPIHRCIIVWLYLLWDWYFIISRIFVMLTNNVLRLILANLEV